VGPQEGERRLTTILAADVVGYSRLMAADEAGTLAQIKAHRKELIEPKTAEYHGRVVKLMGDGTLMEFASVVDAVNFAVDIQRAMAGRNASVPDDRRIAYRIGINIGDVIIDGDDIYGGGVNIAARLEGLAEPGGICVAGNVFEQVRAKVEVGFEDLGEKEVKNILEPVRVFKARLEAEAAGRAVGAAREAKRGWRWPMVAAGLAVLASVVGAGLWLRPWAPELEPASVERMAFPLPDRPSIAILPFDNLSDDPSQDYFADGLTEDIITYLAKFPEIYVIARTSSFAYEAKPVKVQEVAEELGVRYVLEGSVRKASDEIRITTQLVDATSGRHVWAERYDRSLSDLFTVQDEIVANIVTALAVRVELAERKRVMRKPPASMEAYDYYLRGRELQLNSDFWRQEVNGQARALYEKAQELDPQYTRAVVETAWTHLYEFIFGWSEFPEEALARAHELAQKAVRIDPAEPRAHYALGYVNMYRHEHDLAAAGIEKAIALNPNDARFRAGMAGLLIYSGDPNRAIDQMHQAMRQNPHHGDWYFNFLAWANFHARRFDDALAALNRIAQPGASDHRMFAATYVGLGRAQEARSHAAKSLEMDPDFSLAHGRKILPYKKEADLEFYLTALGKAGLPE
jgi:adenylate cyclase